MQASVDRFLESQNVVRKQYKVNSNAFCRKPCRKAADVRSNCYIFVCLKSIKALKLTALSDSTKCGLETKKL